MGLEVAVLLAGEDVLAGGGGDVGFGLEYDGEVGAAEEEVSQRVAFAHAVAHNEFGLEVDGGHLRHAYGQQGHQSVVVGLDHNEAAGFDALPAGDGAIDHVFAELGVPGDGAAEGFVAGDEAHFADDAAHGEVVAVVVVDVEERVGEYAAGEGIAEGRLVADEVAHGGE